MFDSIIEISEDYYVPRMAIIVYNSVRGGDDGSDFYLESHSIDTKGRLLEGVPLTEECISEIASNFSVEQINLPHGAVPENMLYCDIRIGHEKFVWYNPPQKRMMYFVQNLGIENREYCVPGVIYSVESGDLHVYAYKGNKPKLKSILFKPPFFNVTDGKVCLGSGKLDYPLSPSFLDVMNYWEKRFWLTEFSHLGGSSNPTNNNLVVVTKASVDKFDYKELLPMDKRVKELL